MTYATFKSNLSIAQADVAGLTTASSPTFVGLTLSGNINNYNGAGTVINLGNTNTTPAADTFLGGAVGRIFDGSAYREGASIRFYTDAATGANDFPGRISFWTTPDSSASPAERMRIDNAGKVGIGTASPSYKLDIVGRIFVTPISTWTDGGITLKYYNAGTYNYRHLYINSAGGELRFYNGSNEPYIDSSGVWHDASGNNLKEDVKDATYSLGEILELQPREYTVTSTGVKHVAFIAEELAIVLPESVSGEEGKKGITYGPLIAALVNSVKELNTRLNELEKPK